MKNYKLLFAAVILTALASCAKKLDLQPQNGLTSDIAYSTAAGYKNVLAKLYGTLAITGNQGPAGSPDISGGLDEGSKVAFIRGLFNCEELTTDEAICAWNDVDVPDFHGMYWTSTNTFLKGMYARCIYNVTLINEYLRESTDDKLASRGITGTDATDIKNSRAEARFLRAFNYWAMMDLFGKSTFITEADGIGAFLPAEKSRADLFLFVESELKEIESQLQPVKTIEYGRVDQGADWALLARLYLNAGVYTGTTRYADAITYANKVIAGGYSLQPVYSQLFMADNDRRKDEFMFTINCDGLRTQAYGNTSFYIHAASGDDHTQYGADAGWGGYRATKGLADLFPDLTGATDKRALFTTTIFGTSLTQINIPDVSDFKNGLHVHKFVNVRSDGAAVSDPNLSYSDVDFPVFRLSEMYLIYAEATLRGGTGGNTTTALNYVNAIRNRANAGAISAGQLNLQFILDERGRELYWECVRRTDLIRYGQFTTNSYLWPWKGNIATGTAVDPKYNLFPIPSENLNDNHNLTQNTGY